MAQAQVVELLVTTRRRYLFSLYAYITPISSSPLFNCLLLHILLALHFSLADL